MQYKVKDTDKKYGLSKDSNLLRSDTLTVVSIHTFLWHLMISTFRQCFITKLICAVEAQRVLFESYLKALLIKRLVISQTKTVTSAVLPGLFSRLSLLPHCCFNCRRAL